MEYSFRKIGEPEQQLIGGVAYRAQPGSTSTPVYDSQGDYVSDPAVLFDAMLSFAKRGMPIGDMHQDEADAYVVEQFLTEGEAVRKHGVTIPPYSWWVTIRVDDAELWKRISNSELRGLSIGGRASAEGIE